MEKNTKSILENCNFTKTVLMLIIIFYHSILFWKGNWFTPITPTEEPALLKYTAIFLNTFHVHTFTLVSGYIYYYIRYEKERYNDRWAFVLNKTKRLLVPYIFVSIVWVIPITQYFFNYPMKKIITDYLFAISPSQLWFLLMLFCVFIIFYFLSDFIKKHTITGLVLLLMLYGIGGIGQLLLPNIFQIFAALRFMIFFYIGFKFRQFDILKSMKKRFLFIETFIEISLFVIYIYILNRNSNIFKLIETFVEFLLNINGSILCFSLLQKITNYIPWQKNKVFTLFSKISMPVYLFHQQVIYFTLVIFNGINPYIHALLNFLIDIVISVAIGYFFQKFRITRFLIGEK